MKRSPHAVLQALPPIAGATVAAMASVYVAAWLAGAMSVRGATAITMKTNAAACLLLLGLSLVLLAKPEAGTARRWVGGILAAVALAVGVLTFVENLAGWDLGIDQLLAYEAPGAQAVAAPNRMGSPASLGVTFLGVALLLLTPRRPRAIRLVQSLAVVVCLVGLLPTLGYLYGVSWLYGVARVTGIAWPTAVAMIALAAGVLLARPTEGPIAQLTVDDAGGTVLRRLLLPLLLLPIALGWLELLSERMGLVEPAMGATLLVLAFIVSLSALAWLAGRRGSRADAERRRAEDALRESEAQYRLLFASNPTPMMVFDDETLQILAVNDAAVQHYGWTRDEFLGMSVLEMRPPEDRDSARNVIDQFRGRYDALVGPFRHWRKDGTVMDMELRVSSIHFGGRPARLVAMTDVTVRRQAEEALRRYELVVQESRDIILFVRRDDGRILAANPAATETYGYSRDELLSMSVAELRAPGASRERVEADMTDADARGILFETVHQRKDGSTFPAEVSSRGAHVGPVRVLISVVRDISARKWAELALRRANEQLRETDERKNEFLAVLSHELRNPLAPIHNGLQVLERVEPDSEAARRAQEVISRQVRQLSRLVDDLLDVVRVSRNKIRLRMAPVDLNDVVRRTIHDHRSLFDERGIAVETNLCDVPLPLNGDEARLSQVVGNLLQNAAKFTPPGGRVTLRTVPMEGGRAALHVADTGIGIEPETLQRLFQPFMQADTALDRSKGGLGLGLALVKGLVEMHRGQVTAHSEGSGRGTEFVVELPLAAAPHVASEPPAAAPSGSRSRRVLVIEDNADAGETLKTMLELEGHAVRLAHDGFQGLAAAREFRPDVVLCDIGLPGMDGFEVARSLRADPALRTVGLVALSGYALHEDVQRAHQAGFDKHLAKPATPEALHRVLAEVRPLDPTKV